MKHDVVIVYQTVPYKGICRNIAARKIYLQINIPCVSSALKKKRYTIFFLSENRNYIYIYIQWGKKVFSQPPIVQVLPLKKACNFHHRYTSTMRDKIRKRNPENHIVGFFTNLFANDGGK